MMTQQVGSGVGPQATKICIICGKDCAGQPRCRDPEGHYYHKDCHERARKQLAKRVRDEAHRQAEAESRGGNSR